MDKFTEFVLEHEGEEGEALVLQKGRWPDIDVALAADTIAGRRKMRVKVPSWWECAELIYPSRLCVEQCSSEAVCEIKARIMDAVLSGWLTDGKGGVEIATKTDGSEKETGSKEGRDLKMKGLKIADLTGGLGVDSWMFSKMAERVLYVERDSKLAVAAKHNFSVLGCENIEVVNAEVSSEGFVCDASEDSLDIADFVNGEKKDAYRADRWTALKNFAPDIIYLDPSRRGGGGEKVFKLEDCRPNILELRDKLLELAPHVVVKLSPMADINEVVRQLGATCLRADVLSVDGECKEVLVTMERGFEGECMIVADCGKSASFAFRRSEEISAVPRYLTSEDYASLIGKILLEPDKAVMKAAPFKLLSERFGLVKLDVSTHYYIDGRDGAYGDDGICKSNTSEREDDTSGNPKTNDDVFEDNEIDRAEKIGGLFRQFRILRVEPMNKKAIRTIGQDYPNAEVTARNIPLTTDELRKRLAVSISKRGKHTTKNNNDRCDQPAPEGFDPSNPIHIFALRAVSQNLLFITEKLN